MRTFSGGRESTWAGRINFSSRRDQLRGLVFQREAECSFSPEATDAQQTHGYISIPSLLVIVYIWSSYHLGQPNLVLLALMVGAFVALRANHEVIAGGLIAVAAAIKAFPVLAIIYLVYRRYWKAAVSLVATLVFLLLILPAPFRGFERAWHDLEKWSAGMLKYSEVTVGQRPMRSYTWKNQSLIGVSNRLLRHVDADAASAPHQPVYVNFANLSFPVVNGSSSASHWHWALVYRGDASSATCERRTAMQSNSLCSFC